MPEKKLKPSELTSTQLQQGNHQKPSPGSALCWESQHQQRGDDDSISHLQSLSFPICLESSELSLLFKHHTKIVILGVLLVWAPAQNCRNGEELAGWRFPLLPHISPLPLDIYFYSFATGGGESFKRPLLKSTLSTGFDASRISPVSTGIFSSILVNLATLQSFCNSHYC